MDRRSFLTWGVAFGLVGCADLSHRRYSRFERPPATDAPVDGLRGQHDSGPLDERDLLVLLRAIGALDERLARDPAPRAAGPLRWPMDRGLVTSEFGRRWGRLHAGIDIAARAGHPVLAAAPGDAVYAGNRLTGYGSLVVLRHDTTTMTVYAHNRALTVRAGDRVRQGQTIALVGSTGRSTGPHLHFEVRHGGVAIDPRRSLPPGVF